MPSGCGTMSFGELRRLPLYDSAITDSVPLCSKRTTRRARCWHDCCRPWKSNVLPLVLFDGLLYTVTRPSSSSQRRRRSLGMSLQTRNRPCALHAGPSDQSDPVHSRLIGVLPRTSELNRGSTVTKSGSAYVLGDALGPK